MSRKPQTLKQVLSAAEGFLAGKSIKNPGLQSRILLARLFKTGQLDLENRSQDVLSEPQLEAMRRGIMRLANGEPVQYITGEAGFYKHIFKTDNRALIPRPETECLVEAVINCDDLWNRSKPVVVEVGTGSGCIIISLALMKEEAVYIAFDISQDALELAAQNAATHGLAEKIAFSSAELGDTLDPGSIDALVANLPYIPTADYEQLPVHIRDHEPRIALDGGSDGMSIISLTIQDASFALKSGGHLFLEIGDNQGPTVAQMLKDEGFESVEIKQDLTGRDRIVKGVLRPV